MHVPARAGPAGRITAWLGGVAFIASLALFAWCYAVRFSGPAPPATQGAVGPVTTNLFLFTLFALHHSLLARSGAKRWIGRVVPPPLERSAYVWVASALFALTCLAWQEVPGELYRIDAPAKHACLAVQLVGVWLTLHSAGVIDVFELAGIRQAMGWTAMPRFKVIGPYHIVRHPIYLGWALITFGTPAMNATKLTFAIISTAYLAIAIPFEERSLVEVFGAQYTEYQRRVRWRMLPGIY